MTAAAPHDRTRPVHVILKDSTLVLFWPMTADSVMQFANDLETCEVATTTFEGYILDKNSGLVPSFEGATFDLEGNAYIIDDAQAKDVIDKFKYLTAVSVTARTFFPQ